MFFRRYQPHQAALSEAPGCKVAMCADAGQREEEARCHHTCAQVLAGPGVGVASDSRKPWQEVEEQ
eukprot:137556-Pelagomonas_calceolata.AAC.2